MHQIHVVLGFVITLILVSIGIFQFSQEALADVGQCLLREEAQAIHSFMSDWRTILFTKYLPEVRNPIYDLYNELVKLPSCESLKEFVEPTNLVNTYTGSMAVEAPDLVYLDKLYQSEGFNSHELQNRLFITYVFPFPVSLQKEPKTIVEKKPEIVQNICEGMTVDDCFDAWFLDTASNYPNVIAFVISMNSEGKSFDYYSNKTSFYNDEGQDYLLLWVGCTKKTISHPSFRIHSDLDDKIIRPLGILPNDYCTLSQYTTIQAKDPNLIKLNYFETTPDPSQKIIKIIETKQMSTTDIYNLLLRICAGSESVEDEPMVISSDKETTEFIITTNIGPGSCYTDTKKIKANDPSSINAQFGNLEANPEIIQKIVMDTIKKLIAENEPRNQIPEWIRNNAKWWSEGNIEDNDFVSGIQFLIKEDIMQIPETTSTTTASESNEIPSWIKNNADWWSQRLISDDDFVKGIQYLVEQGIIRV